MTEVEVLKKISVLINFNRTSLYIFFNINQNLSALTLKLLT